MRLRNLPEPRTENAMELAIYKEGRPSPAWARAMSDVLKAVMDIRKQQRLRLVVSNKSKKLRKVPRLAG
jgi:hypothetical protein